MPAEQEAGYTARASPRETTVIGMRWGGVLRGEATAAGDGGGQGVWGIGSGENIFSLANYFP